MKKNIAIARRPSMKSRVKSVATKLSAVVVSSMVSASAFAQAAAGDMPASVDGAATFMTSKGGIAIAVAAAITLITLGITAAKLPRKGS
ncbi:hypothetical protein [Stenotrophomonas maltophilia]|uniref:hypothetical protein n=1 Tax=Stenotrophomonas maltophilia TaxID=40324 RepID=UPI0013135D93|nr:hypothetical protein [Stenotrophomonas maltophilia]MBA0415450.1 hypothetical protein [Stenotrophomonas maltophilia]HDS1091465.1 hypothetical protein [Stenotrophomonas maltophilia]HEL3220246.1 hypothetical protein [Stenotrophomonas maltophilia]